GINTSRQKPKSVTYVSGTNRHLCLGPLRLAAAEGRAARKGRLRMRHVLIPVMECGLVRILDTLLNVGANKGLGCICRRVIADLAVASKDSLDERFSVEDVFSATRRSLLLSKGCRSGLPYSSARTCDLKVSCCDKRHGLRRAYGHGLALPQGLR
ncbi:hypothetical protein, partial [Mesorhizobium sp. M0208]|uniref:hypothetical protein n=1 Tax=Mesorhizobium sp. M0208 TaxID=2956916 RepID=UPI003335C0EE